MLRLAWLTTGPQGAQDNAFTATPGSGDPPAAHCLAGLPGSWAKTSSTAPQGKVLGRPFFDYFISIYLCE